MIDEFAHLDFETKSKTNLLKSGVYRYAEDPSTGTHGFSYEFNNDGMIYQWRPGMPDPERLLALVRRGGIIKAHNAGFERRIWNIVLPRNYGLWHWPQLTIKQMDCTMSRAATMTYPQKLEKLGPAMGLSQTKDNIGHSLMLKYASPRKFNPDGTILWWDDPNDINRIMQYCDQDIRTESEADKFLPPLTERERAVWEFDQVINDRGVCIDLPAVQRCAEMVEFAKKKADSEMRSLTQRCVPKCTNDGAIIEWIQNRGIECTTVKKAVQDDLMFLADLNSDPLVRDVIALRRAAKKTSTAKYKAMLACVSADGRIRGLLAYHGASTGRWAGRLVQPQNFPRIDEEEYYIIEWLHELLKNPHYTVPDIYEMVVMVHGGHWPLVLLSRALRTMIVPAEGKKLVGGDFSNIEGRINAWIAGEHWKLDAFRAYDTVLEGQFDKKGKPLRAGPDLYILAASGILGKELDLISSFERQSVGKVSELALGFQGSVGAFISMGDNYGITPYDLSRPIALAANPAQWDATAEQYHKKGTNKHDLQEKEWVAVKIIVDNWRKKNGAITQSWWDLQDAAIQAVQQPGFAVSVCGGKVQYYSDGNYLWCVIPGGRMLCYISPRVVSEAVERERPDGTKYTTYKRKVMYWAEDSETRQWKEHALYGGHQCENIVQAAARDVMVDRMFAAEYAGFPLILTVHDELLTEPDAHSAYHNDKTLQHIMSVVPPGFEGLPLTAAAWEGTRYN